jgi:hypothetical protein
VRNGVFVDKGLRIHRLRQSGEIDEVAPPCLWTRGFIRFFGKCLVDFFLGMPAAREELS